MKAKWLHITLVCMTSFLILSCSAYQHARDVRTAEERGDALTVGKVQREITKGMTGGQVAETLGSPNIVSTDEQGREVWVYDRFATDVTYSETRGGVWLLLGAVGGSSGAASRSQRTLTVIVKFDENKRVREIVYHSSRF